MAVKRRVMDAPELNLVPIMNLVTILIPFLIMAAQFVQLAVIDSTLPAIGAPQTAATNRQGSHRHHLLPIAHRSPVA